MVALGTTADGVRLMSAGIPVMKPWFDDAEVEAAAAAIRSGWVAQGPRVAEFEEGFARSVGAEAGVAVTSCTAGLHLAMYALGLEAGDEVIVPSLSFIATANAVRYVGAIPVFADVDLTTQNVTAESIAQVVTERTKAVMVVHQVGMPADLDPIHDLCDTRGLMLVEDAACAAGSTYRGSPIGGGPSTAVFSFHPRKLLTTGEGGMITTQSPDQASRFRRLREHGMSVDTFARHTTKDVVIEQYLETGFNFRMTDVQAAIGLVQLGKLDEMIARRRALADEYKDALDGVPGLVLPGDPPYGTTNYQSFSVVLTADYSTERIDLMSALQAEGISSRRGVMAIHREPAYEGHPSQPLPNTDYLTDRSIILPLYHQMTHEDIERVASIVRTGAAA
ncbi:MAG: DegT/DnrJ/EryC1/StrS family aminotransferase [Acidimicrobiia bacterium]|nr:MAG: DegT/DnrJ/EryC1/StrS family aminotransferase [Acidimicrobiia bacterium]